MKSCQIQKAWNYVGSSISGLTRKLNIGLVHARQVEPSRSHLVSGLMFNLPDSRADLNLKSWVLWPVHVPKQALLQCSSISFALKLVLSQNIFSTSFRLLIWHIFCSTLLDTLLYYWEHNFTNSDMSLAKLKLMITTAKHRSKISPH